MTELQLLAWRMDGRILRMGRQTDGHRILRQMFRIYENPEHHRSKSRSTYRNKYVQISVVFNWFIGLFGKNEILSVANSPESSSPARSGHPESESGRPESRIRTRRPSEEDLQESCTEPT